MLFSASRTLVIAEVAQAHDGSLGAAHAYIDAVARAGADAVKFQTHIAAAESTPAEPWRVRFSPQDATRYDYWRRMEFTEEQWAGLKRHAAECRLEFLSSPFSLKAAEILSRIGVSGWKIASGEAGNQELWDFVLATRRPVLLSTGMSRVNEINAAVTLVKNAGVELAVLQCTSAYPCPAEKVGLNVLDVFRRRYRCAVGLSDHSGTIYAGLGAAALGAEVIEVHVTFSRECFGPDVPASVTTPELAQLVEGVRFLERARAHPVDKDVIALDMSAMRAMFTKSVVAEIDMPAGFVLRRDALSLKKPGSGFPAARIPDLIGRKLRRAVAAGQLLSEADLAEPAAASAAD
ncbi:MAG TPA: N-acetylneuraminate synthase family protein [Bryobacteraceae bacterium]